MIQNELQGRRVRLQIGIRRRRWRADYGISSRGRTCRSRSSLAARKNEHGAFERLLGGETVWLKESNVLLLGSKTGITSRFLRSVHWSSTNVCGAPITFQIEFLH